MFVAKTLSTFVFITIHFYLVFLAIDTNTLGAFVLIHSTILAFVVIHFDTFAFADVLYTFT